MNTYIVKYKAKAKYGLYYTLGSWLGNAVSYGNAVRRCRQANPRIVKIVSVSIVRSCGEVIPQ